MCLFTNRSSYSSACIMMQPLYPFVPPFFLHNCVWQRFAVDTFKWFQCETSQRHFSIYALLQNCWNWGIMVFRYQDMGHTFHEHILRTFCYGWMDCKDGFLCLYCCVTNGQNIADYKVYWLIGAPIINPWNTHQPFFLLKWHARINQPKLLCFQKSKQTRT